jgi:hypothetical protein
MTCEQGDKHRWDESRSRCLDCERDAATIVEELEEWLAQTEDSVDRLSDRIEAMRVLLEDAQSLIADDNDDSSNWLERCSVFLSELEE